MGSFFKSSNRRKRVERPKLNVLPFPSWFQSAGGFSHPKSLVRDVWITVLAGDAHRSSVVEAAVLRELLHKYMPLNEERIETPTLSRRRRYRSPTPERDDEAPESAVDMPTVAAAPHADPHVYCVLSVTQIEIDPTSTRAATHRDAVMIKTTVSVILGEVMPGLAVGVVVMSAYPETLSVRVNPIGPAPGFEKGLTVLARVSEGECAQVGQAVLLLCDGCGVSLYGVRPPRKARGEFSLDEDDEETGFTEVIFQVSDQGDSA